MARPGTDSVRLIYTLVSALIIIGVSFAAIEYAKGNYRITREGFIPNTGLLSANSFPTGAEVYVDGRLITATDDTLYLEPGTYDINIVKEGYWPWSKTITLEEELVAQTNAQLFPIAPSLVPLTSSGVQKVVPSPDGQKLLYFSNSATTESKNGLYVLELTDSLLSLQRGSRQIATTVPGFDLENAHFIWSPDSSSVLVITDDKDVLIEVNRSNNLSTAANVRFQRQGILSEWEEEMYLRERQFLSEFPEEMIQIATASARNVYISPDKKRLLYTATESATIPDNIVPPVPAPNSQPQSRQLEANQVYIYDREDDRNFAVGTEQISDLISSDIEVTDETGTEETVPGLGIKRLLATDLYSRQPLSRQASPSAFRQLQVENTEETVANFNRYHTALHLNTYQWFPDSKHILYTTDSALQIKGYDNTNDISVYSGPFQQNFVYPWPDGNKLVVLTSFNPETPANLYAIELE